GVYRFSRNPLYLGVFLLIVASVLYAPHPVNILCGVMAIGIHHLIVTREESYLINQYGETYLSYMKRVRRYL
ncbi:MAG: methyltransferase, partial [Smithellaceae bacterium]|nr:methyltransferase [Smithellaceae bacterium]